jgi:hypothetical protein
VVSDDYYERERSLAELNYPYNLHLLADGEGVVHLYEQRDGRLFEQPLSNARHGRGALGHGGAPECEQDQYGEFCNNGQCRSLLNHDRCTPQCSSEAVWDAFSCWRPGAPNLRET